jgi:metallo-beta-lactamase class B
VPPFGVAAAAATAVALLSFSVRVIDRGYLKFLVLLSALVTVAGHVPAAAASEGAAAPPAAAVAADCPQCAEWTVRQTPFRVYGNTYYVGTRALSSILITSRAGHVLIDGTVAEAAPQVSANIRALGFRVEDIRLILNSHVHFDHAGGLAALQHLSGARVAASAASARALTQGHSGPDDPQYGALSRGTAPLEHVQVVEDGETLQVGALRLTAHLTPGHTPGGTSWTWVSCEQARCLHLVYADSLSAISVDGFRFSHNSAYPNVLQDFARSFALLSALPCDILLTPHPEASDTWQRLQRRDAGSEADAFIDSDACRSYARSARAGLQKRLAEEQQR